MRNAPPHSEQGGIVRCWAADERGVRNHPARRGLRRGETAAGVGDCARRAGRGQPCSRLSRWAARCARRRRRSACRLRPHFNGRALARVLETMSHPRANPPAWLVVLLATVIVANLVALLFLLPR